MGRTPFPAPRRRARPNPGQALRRLRPYDFLVACPERATSDRRGHFLRVQVKCSLQRREKNSYRCVIDHNGTPYTPAQIDFFAAYVIPQDVFYILPLAATNHQPDILLTPHRQNSKYAKYKEAWHLLMTDRPKPLRRGT